MLKSHLPKLTLKAVRKILLTSLVLIIIFTAGFILGAKTKQNPDSLVNVIISREVSADKNLDFSLFWIVWDTLEQSYYDKTKIIPANLVYGAIKGMVDAINDPYTTFLIPRENEVIQEDLQGNFEGVGIQIGFRGTQLAVVAPLPNSPAEKAGVHAGDFIVGIKDDLKNIDRGTIGINLPEAVQDIRGPAGTSVTLVLVRDGADDPIVVDLIRESIEIPSLILKFVGPDENVAYIRLLKFGGETVNEWDNAVLEILKKRDLAGIIIDVRNNTGGYLQAAIDIASDFLDEDKIIVIEEKSADQKNEFTSTRIARFKREPTIILVNQGSASASEILAGALRDQRGISLVGQTTFGKGTIQESRQVNGGAALHITVARWLTPSEFWVNDVGLEPDVTIEDNPETPEDEQLDKAIELLENTLPS
jgi:carboxyl-terminal processing protease